MIKAPKTIIICGTGRNVGKTLYAQKVIKEYTTEFPIAIKISSHFHSHDYEMKAIELNSNYKIWQELNADKTKDSSRMLASGAKAVYYIEAKDEFIPAVINKLTELVNFNDRIIIESAAIRNYIEPSEFVLVFSDEYPFVKDSMKNMERFITSRISIDRK
ncbi:MAG: hypothetical protein KAG84_02900 [Bacteroidales bacterium]|nr:hypothetical protein [Bacteroidales bacterium]